jgi:hypothetical protein
MRKNIQKNCQICFANILIFFISSSLILGRTILDAAAQLTPAQAALQNSLSSQKMPKATPAPPSSQPPQPRPELPDDPSLKPVQQTAGSQPPQSVANTKPVEQTASSQLPQPSRQAAVKPQPSRQAAVKPQPSRLALSTGQKL